MRASRLMRGRPRARLAAAGAAVVSLLVFSIAALAGPVGILSGFEDDDGNLVDNTGTADIDWNSFDPTTWTGTAPNRTSTKTALGWNFLGIEDAQATTSDTGFAGGTKQDDNCATVISAKAPNKDDMKRVYVSSKIGAGRARVPESRVGEDPAEHDRRHRRTSASSSTRARRPAPAQRAGQPRGRRHADRL